MRGARLLGTAEVVFHDALIEPEMLGYAPHALRIAAGKRCGQYSTAQCSIEKQLIAAARKHQIVVRLKGGDPMIFGRADEEMRALEAADVDYEIIPGITTALACAQRCAAHSRCVAYQAALR
jgi:uroporphyrin-III C-methyltransferase